MTAVQDRLLNVSNGIDSLEVKMRALNRLRAKVRRAQLAILRLGPKTGKKRRKMLH
jgi:hypothetical protein